VKNLDRKALATAVLLPLLMLARFAFRNSFDVGEDANSYFLPLHALLHSMFVRGELHFWNPAIFGGTPLAGNPQAAMFYPLGLGKYLLEPSLSFRLLFLTHVSLASAFTYAFCRERGLPNAAALISALCYSCSGTVLLGVFQVNQVCVAAWLPAAVWMLERYRSTGKALYLRLEGVAVAMFWLAGFPQIALYAQLALALYTLVRLPKLRALLEPLLWGFGLSAVQNFPFLEAARHTVRAGVDLGQWCFTDGLSLRESLHYLAPWMRSSGDDLAAYFSTLGLLLALLAARRQPAWLALAVLFFVLSLGGQGPLAWLLPHLPLLNCFKAPSRLNFLTTFCLAILAGEGASRCPRGMLILVFLELALQQAVHLHPRAYPVYLEQEPAALKQMSPLERFATLPDTHVQYGNSGELWGLCSVIGVDALPLDDWCTLLLVSQLGAPLPPFARVAMAHHSGALPLGNLTSPLLRLLNLGWTLSLANGQPRAQRLPPPVSRAFVVPRWVQLPPNAQLGFLTRPGFVPEQAACIDGPAGEGNGGQAEVVLYQSDLVRIRVICNGPSLMVLSDNFFPGWSATVNGRPTPIYRADLALRGVLVPGSCEVEFRYVSSSLRLGVLVSLATLLLLIASVRRRSDVPVRTSQR
jgi:hypothetical protein